MRCAPLDEQATTAVASGEVPLTTKASLMRSVNDGIAFFAADLDQSDPERWTFVCECGGLDCAAWVELDLAEYRELSSAGGGSVLAQGHVAPSAAERARSDAADLREQARAVRAQAKLQQGRSRRLLQ